MAILYRSANRLRQRWWCRFARVLWLIREIEDIFHAVRIFKTLAAFLAALLCLPIAVTIFTVLKLLRYIRNQLICHYFPDVGITDDENSFRGVVDTKRNQGQVAAILTLEGTATLDEIRKRVATEISENKRYRYPLKRKLMKKFGLYCWKDAQDFKIENHVIEIGRKWNGHPLTDTTLKNLVSEVCSKPFPKEQPPWQIIVVQFQNPKTSIIFRFHHLLSTQLPLKEFMKFDEFLDPWKNLSPEHSALTENMFVASSTTRQILSKTCLNVNRFVNHTTQLCDPNVEINENHLSIVITFVRKVMRLMYDAKRVYNEVKSTRKEKSSNTHIFHRALLTFYIMPRLIRGLAVLMKRTIKGWSRKCCRNTIFGEVLHFIYLMVIVASNTPITIVKCLFALFTNARLKRSLFHKLQLALQVLREIYYTGRAILCLPITILDQIFFRSHVSSVKYPLFGRAGSGRKVVSWSDPVPLETIRRLSEASASSNSEVILFGVAACLTQYFRRVCIQVPEVVFSAFSVREGVVVFPLPTVSTSGLSLLHAIQSRLQTIRNSPSLNLLSVHFVPRTPAFLPDFIVAIALHFLSYFCPLTVCSITLEPSVSHKLWDRQISRFLIWNSPQANTAVSLNLVSYRKNISLVASSDHEVLPQPHILTEHFVKEINSLASELGVRPWKRPLREAVSMDCSGRNITSTMMLTRKSSAPF